MAPEGHIRFMVNKKQASIHSCTVIITTTVNLTMAVILTTTVIITTTVMQNATAFLSVMLNA